MKERLESVGRAYIHGVFIPALIEKDIDLDGLDLVIGGSVSTGFADPKSDIDIYLLFDESRRDDIMRAREFMFMPKRVEGANLQIVPCAATAIGVIASGDIPSTIPIELLYDVSHYMPVTEPTDALLRAMATSRDLPSGF